MVRDERTALIERVLGDRFELQDLLGKGGFATVYRVRSRGLGRFEALKVLHDTHPEDPDFAKRFQQEARVAASLEHPNIAKVYDFGQAGGVFWYSMQCIDGPTATKKLRSEGPLKQDEAARIGAAVLDALDYSHQQGVIHRDIKPDNIIQDARGHVFLMDFGVAKSDQNVVKTQTGFILGSPAYVSPEQLRGEKLDGRSDLYSVGVSLYQLLADAYPFTAEDRMGLLMKRFTDPPEPLSWKRPGIHPQLEAIVMRSLARSRDARFATAGEMRDALEEYLERPTTQLAVAPEDRTVYVPPEAEEVSDDEAGVAATTFTKPMEGGNPAPTQATVLRPSFSRPVRTVEPPESIVPVEAPVPPPLPARPVRPALPVPVAAPVAAPPALRRFPAIPVAIAAVLVCGAVLTGFLLRRPAAAPLDPVATPAPTPPLPLPTMTPALPEPTFVPTLAPPTAVPTEAPRPEPTEAPTPRPLPTRAIERPRPTEAAPHLRAARVPPQVNRIDPEGIPSSLRQGCARDSVDFNFVWDADGRYIATAAREVPPIPAPCERAAREMLSKRFEVKPPLDGEGRPTAGKALIRVPLE